MFAGISDTLTFVRFRFLKFSNSSGNFANNLLALLERETALFVAFMRRRVLVNLVSEPM